MKWRFLEEVTVWASMYGAPAAARQSFWSRGWRWIAFAHLWTVSLVGIPLADAVLLERELQNDYVRLATLELICRRLENVPGAAAELGVSR